MKVLIFTFRKKKIESIPTAHANISQAVAGLLEQRKFVLIQQP